MARLERGWDLCERERDPAKRDRLETFWMSLLHADDRACDAHQRETVAAAEIDAHADALELKRHLTDMGSPRGTLFHIIQRMAPNMRNV